MQQSTGVLAGVWITVFCTSKMLKLAWEIWLPPFAVLMKLLLAQAAKTVEVRRGKVTKTGTGR